MLVHLDFLKLDHIVLISSSKLFNILCLDFFDLAANQYLVHDHFDDIQSNLLADHDHNQVRCQLSEVTHPVCDDVVGDVRVDELEHVHLVDETVFIGLLIAMVLSFNQGFCNFLVDSTIDEDKQNVNDTGRELEVHRDLFAVLVNVLLSPNLHTDLRPNHQNDEEDRNGDAHEDLTIVSIEA